MRGVTARSNFENLHLLVLTDPVCFAHESLGELIDLLFSPEANETAAEFVRNKIRRTVKDPKVAELLCPKTVIGCKRLCVDTGYYETFNRPNVESVDVSEVPISIQRAPRRSPRAIRAYM